MPAKTIGQIVMRLILLPFAALPLFFTGAGVYTAVQQHQRITTYRPIEATVVSSEVRVSRGKSTSYRPDITYQYTVDGRSYTSDQVLPIKMSTGRKEAERIVRERPRGKMVVAYYNPSDPADAILIRQYSFLPYFFILFSMIFVVFFTFGVGGAALGFGGKKEPERLGQGYRLWPDSTLARSWRNGVTGMAIWQGVGLCALAHYLVTARPAQATFAIIAFVIYFALGFIPFFPTRKAYRLSQRMTTPRCSINTPHAMPGAILEVEIEQRLDEPAPAEVRIGLVCEQRSRATRKGSWKSERWHEQFAPAAAPRARSTYRAKTTLTVPPDALHTQQSDTYQVQWHIAVVTEYADGLKYEAKFPLQVLAHDVVDEASSRWESAAPAAFNSSETR